MKMRDVETLKIFIFDVAHDNLSDLDIVKGMIQHYLLNGYSVDNLQDDMVFKTLYQPEVIKNTLEHVKAVLSKFVKGGDF